MSTDGSAPMELLLEARTRLTFESPWLDPPVTLITEDRILNYLCEIDRKALPIRWALSAYQAADRTVIITSNKWPNILLDLRASVLSALGGIVGSATSFALAWHQSNELLAIAAVMSSLAVWSTLQSAKEIQLEPQHGRVLLLLHSLVTKRGWIDSVAWNAAQRAVEASGSEFEAALFVLQRLRIVRVNWEHKTLVLSERLLSVSPELLRNACSEMPPELVPDIASDHERAVAATQRAGRVIERRESLSRGRNESDLQDAMVLSLTTSLDDLTVSSESELNKGRSDILIMRAHRVVAVLELKIWSGPANLVPALKQAINYQTWSDLPAITVFFVRAIHFENILRRARQRIESDACCRIKSIEDYGSTFRGEYITRRAPRGFIAMFFHIASSGAH